MNKLGLLRTLNNEGVFADLTGEELRLFLLMIAGSTENGDGEILLGRISWAFGEKFPLHRLRDICASLEKKQLVRVSSRLGQGGRTIAYRIISQEGVGPVNGHGRG